MKNLLFIDIETVSQHKTYAELGERMKNHWARKSAFLQKKEEQTEDELYGDRAGIYAEFGKVIVIGAGYFAKNNQGELTLRITSFKNDNEKDLLLEFSNLLNKFDEESLQLCGHNGKEFDFPYLCRRMLVNGIKLPYVLNTSGKKPWEVNHLDTMQMWKFGDYKHFTSLDLLASIFDIETSKDDIDGSEVGHVYYEQNDLEKIAIYCSRDVAVTAQLYLKLKSLPDIKPQNIIFLT